MATPKKEEISAEKPLAENNDCFIIMPIADHPEYNNGHFKRVYEDIFAPACRAAGYKPVRADDVAQTNLIQLDILEKLLQSPMAICDLSTRNPNVLFELGLRQAFDMPTILVQEVGTPPIFDISMFRYTTYNKALDYREVLADQHNIQKVLEETKTAVSDGKSVNSIVKLLSISQPAKLEDSSNFGEKEYFDVLMSEIRGIKTEISRSKSQKFPSGLETIIHNSSIAIKYTINFPQETLIGNVKDFLNNLRSYDSITEADMDLNEEEKILKIIAYSNSPNLEPIMFHMAKKCNISLTSIQSKNL